MDIYAARLASFNVAHPTTKKRGSNAKGPKSLKWPHKTPSPTQLAQAGFYFAPTVSAPDNATCFLCERGLDGWEADDDPVREHLNFATDCGWAVNMAIEQAVENGMLGEDDPMSAKLVEARKSTFNGRWPHEGKRGWTCKTQKMIEAGWYCCPTPESDDFVKCPYCSLSLDGWEPKDKPFDEHQRRSPECAFFTLSQSSGAKSAKGKRGRPSNTSRASIQSNMTTGLDDQSMMNTVPQEGDSINTTATGMTTASTVLRAGKKGGNGKKTKGKSQLKAVKTMVDESLQGSSFVEPEDDDFSVKVMSSPVITKGKKRSSDEMNVNDEPTTADIQPAKRRATRIRASAIQPQQVPEPVSIEKEEQDAHMTDAEELPPVRLPTSKKGAKKGKKQGSSTSRKPSAMSTATVASLRGIPADEEIDAVLEADLDRPLTDDEKEVETVEPVEPKSRRLTRSRPGTRNVTASVAPVRSATRMSSALIEDIHVEVRVELERSPPKHTSQETLIGGSQASSTVTVDMQPRELKTKGKKGKGAKKTTDAPQVVIETLVTSDTAVEAEARDAQSTDDKDQSGQNPENHPTQHEELIPAKGRSAVQPASKRAKGRQPSRKLPGRTKKASIISAPQPVADPVIDLESSTLTLKTAEDGSGHETDASTLSQATVKRGARKGSTVKKGKKPKKAVGSRNIEDVVQARSQPVAEDSAEAPVTTPGKITNVVPTPISPVPQVDNDIKVGQPPVEVAEDAAPKPKGPRGRPKGKNASRAPSAAEEQIQAVPKSPITEQPIAPVAPQEAILSSRRNSMTFTPKLLPPTPKHAVPSPTPSPQSSDAENQPPSSRPSQTRPPLFEASPSRAQTIRVPLAASTPTTSPSRRNNTSKVQTTLPWTSVDLESIFFSSPKPGKENVNTLDGMKNSLTSPEKRMTVEEWIKYNASQGEEKLRNECERLVGRFESEGNRALRILEGIICEE
ncbi:hypothetical protein MMC30_002089 [Trapelia coarctata]|nr:hypothetical protein [Trapelia coarctata]